MTSRDRRATVLLGAGVCLLCLFLALVTAGAHAAPASSTESTPAPTLERIDALIAGQAWQLALRALDAAAADNALYSENFERRRVLVHRQLADPAALAAVIERLPADASTEFRQWAWEQLAETALATGDFDRVRHALEQRFPVAAADAGRDWRERLVRAYLAEGRSRDALAVFAPLAGRDDARTLHAEILLHAGRDREAFERVAGLVSVEARLWRLIAARRLGLYTPEDTVLELSLLLRELRDRPGLQRLAWLLRADAARQTGQLSRRVNSLEQAFRFDSVATDSLVAGTPDHLWSAYLALGRHIARAEELSLGAGALARADAYRKQDPYSARALYAWHAIDAKDEDIRVDAHGRLVGDLTARQLNSVARALYTGSKRFVPGDMPHNVRYVLMQDAVQRRDLRTAAKHARALKAPPGDEAAADWDLRRARILLYGGEHATGLELLGRLVAGDAFDAPFAQRFLQVVFDLQALGKHVDALALLESMYRRADDARMRRELLYWQAESAGALARFADAAELYLRSAYFAGGDGADPWGHSARFRAAEALVSARLSRDAETLYRALLEETSDPDRRLMIEQKIERLWLAAPAGTKP